MPAIVMKKEVPVEAKTLSIHMKVCDRFSARLLDQNGEEIFNQEDGYVPGFMPGNHFGDYVILDIDLDSGTITNWKPVVARAIEEWISTQP